MAPGLNLFFGDNEAGKSTLQQAICAMLYGFFEGERATVRENAQYERFRPWAGGVYRGAMAYELDDGRAFEVRRDFATTDVVTRVSDAVLGTDVTPQFARRRHGNVAFAHEHIGMSRAVFQSCAFISQGEIFDAVKASPSQIGDAIAAMADSARRDVSATQAIGRLEAAAQKVGSDRARTADLPKAREALQRVQLEMRAHDEARRSVAEKSRRLEELQTEIGTLMDRALRAGFLFHRAEAERLREKLRGLSEAEIALAEANRLREELRGYGAISPVAREEVISLSAKRERAGQTLASLRQQAALVPDLSQEERLAYEALRESVGGFNEAQVRALEASAYRTEWAPTSDAWVLRVLTAIVAAVASVVRGVVRFVLRRKPAPDSGAVQLGAGAPSHQQEEVSQGEAIALLEKHRRYLVLRPMVEERARIERQVADEERSLASIEERLRAVLDESGISWALLDEGVAAFGEAWRRREAFVAAERAAEEAERRRELLLNGSTRAEMDEALAEHESDVGRMVAEHPRLDGLAVTHTADQLARAESKSRDEAHRCELEASRLEEDVRLTLAGFRSRAEIEEDVAHWTREVQRLERARAALNLAKEAIDQAMHDVYRDFAPAVNAFLSEGLEAATDGKYQRAHVDPSTLRVSLLVPETGQVITDPPVSHGTRTLLYVLMRIGLAQHMSAIGEPVPLVLDDPFVDVDSRRLRRILQFLLDLSTRMQILLFSKDREVLEWFQERATGVNHRIHSLSSSLVTGNV
jgi:uncharacterized protein YhaN